MTAQPPRGVRTHKSASRLSAWELRDLKASPHAPGMGAESEIFCAVLYCGSILQSEPWL